MIETSAEYKAAIQQNLRGSMEFRAVIAVENLLFKKLAVLTDNGHLFFSNVQELKTEQEVKLVNVTAETNMYILDGTRELLPQQPEYQGFVSDKVSTRAGVFVNAPKIIITSDDLRYDLAGLMLTFDTFNNDYATDFIINYYFGEQLEKSIHVKDNTNAVFSSEERADGINTIELIFLKTHNINRRLRLLDIVFGLRRVFTGSGQSGIINMEHKLLIHPLMTEIPQNELFFEIRDAKAEYNPENLTGIWKYMTAGQGAWWDYYFNVSPEIREKVPGGKFYLQNPPTTQGENTKFQLTGLLQTLTMPYDEGVYYPGGRSYYDLFNDVFNFADIPKDEDDNSVWHVDESLKNYRCYLPLPRKSCVELIQILCQNTGVIPFEDIDGHLYIRPNTSEMSDNLLRLKTAYEYPNYDPQLPELRSILLTRHSVTVEAATTELNKSEHLISGTKTIMITYTASTEQKAVITGGTLVAEKYFAYACLLTISANNVIVPIVINGKKLTTVKSQRVYDINPQGEDAVIEMDLLSDDTLCDRLAVIYAKYLQEKKRYKFEYLGDPARRANDLFPINTRFATNLPAQVISSEYSYSDGSKGVLELKDYG